MKLIGKKLIRVQKRTVKNKLYAYYKEVDQILGEIDDIVGDLPIFNN